jgi:hypothetical protein
MEDGLIRLAVGSSSEPAAAALHGAGGGSVGRWGGLRVAARAGAIK